MFFNTLMTQRNHAQNILSWFALFGTTTLFCPLMQRRILYLKLFISIYYIECATYFALFLLRLPLYIIPLYNIHSLLDCHSLAEILNLKHLTVSISSVLTVELYGRASAYLK